MVQRGRLNADADLARAGLRNRNVGPVLKAIEIAML
jgi:hypothetical protein